MSIPPEEFQELLQNARSGCRQATKVLFDHYSEIIRQEVRRRLRQPVRQRVDSVDVLQDVWGSFFTRSIHENEFRSPEDLGRFLLGMARNKTLEVCRDNLAVQKRDARREVPLDDDRGAAAFSVLDSEPTPEEKAAREDRWQLFLALLPTERWRQCFIMLANGRSYEEIAEQFGYIGRAASKMWARARQRLAERDAAYPDGW